MKSIRWKLVLMYIALVFIVMVISGTLMIVSIRRNEESNAQNSLEQSAKQIKTVIKEEFNDAEEAFESGSIKARIGNSQAFLISASGRTLQTSEETDADFYPNYTQAVVISALDGKALFEPNRRYVESGGVESVWMEYAMPVFYENEPEQISYVLYLRSDASNKYEEISTTTNIIAMAVVFATVLTGILGALFSSTLTDPIRLLTSKAKELAEGNLNQTILVGSKDEIGQLTESFNYMAKELSSSLAEMEREKNKLEIVLFNMTDGVLAYDSNEVLIHANSISKELLNIKNLEILRFSELMNLLKIDSSQNMFHRSDYRNVEGTTLALGDKFVDASFNPYDNKDGILEGVVVVLQDITKHKRLDNMRKEFVANVSHEIRTPLTSIKSYTETLIDGVDDKATEMEFLDIINSEADRMTLIVKDLLDLSSLDNNQMVLDLKEIDLIELIRQTVRQHKMTAEKQNKEIIFEEITNDKIIVNADHARIAQVLSNILSNAIKYSYEGASIVIQTDENKDFYRIYVRDNGMGIPKADLRRIFERFYRVDKARSRAMGGTGLGLSIAKEIMEAHGGRIIASSEVGKGTTMVLRFPKMNK